MSEDSERWTAVKLADEAVRAGISLGTNPERTIKYYKALGLLKPTVVQEGSARRAYYARDHLVVLRMVQKRQREGNTLAEIKTDLERQIYLSADGRKFLEQFKGKYPETAFLPGAPITRAEMAFLITSAYEVLGPQQVLTFIHQAFVLGNGEPAVEEWVLVLPEPKQLPQ